MSYTVINPDKLVQGQFEDVSVVLQNLEAIQSALQVANQIIEVTSTSDSIIVGSPTGPSVDLAINPSHVVTELVPLDASIVVSNEGDGVWGLRALGGGGGGGDGGFPSASLDGVVDNTSWDDPITGSGKLTAMAYPDDRAVFAYGITGDPYPRWLFTSDNADGIYIGDGTISPYDGANIWATAHGSGILALTMSSSNGRFEAGIPSGVGDYENRTDAPCLRVASLGIRGGGYTDPNGFMPGNLGDLYISDLTVASIGAFWRCVTTGDAATAAWTQFS